MFLILLLIPSTFILYYNENAALENIYSYPQTAKKATALFSQSLRYK